MHAHAGRTAEASKQYALVEYIGRLSALNQIVYNRELALFYADHGRRLPEALDLARRELDVRRDVYTWDVLAWTLLPERPRAARRPPPWPMRCGSARATRACCFTPG